VKAPHPVRNDDPIIRMVGARFQGRVEDGRSFLIGAREAARDERQPHRVSPDRADHGGRRRDRHAAPADGASMGVYDEQTRLLQLTGDVRIDDGLGNRIASNDITIDTRTGSAVGQQGIEGDGPVGQVSADSYTVKDKGDRIEFRGRVRTRVNPE
jgi:lipopolysaccharide export system protein LptC